LQYAIRNFVSSFYHFNHFENKYPEITKMLWKKHFTIKKKKRFTKKNL
jgi:hypothetical protein